jgi:hypothetical protein
MTTFKDILYKKNDDETWAEWNNRLPTDDDKRDYIGETIYAKIYDENKERAGKITGMLLVMDVEDLIVLLESDELLDEKIKEAYEILREGEEEYMYEEEIYAKEREGFFYNYKLEKWCEAALWEEYDAEVQADDLMNTVLDNKYGAWGWGIKEEEAYKEEKLKAEKDKKEEEEEAYKEEKLKAEKDKKEEEEEEEKEEKEEEEKEENRYDEEDDDDYKQPVTTLTVAEMIEALSKLPQDAKLVMTESGCYSNSEFAEVMLPRPYKVENYRFDCDLPTGTQVYIIGHSHQSY